VLFTSLSLLRPEHAQGVVGLASLRAGVEALFGPLTNVAFASQIFGLYAGFVYFTPVFGGLIADRWLGRRRSVVIGAVLMSAGHFAMAFESSFLFALLLIILGCGLLKGNISTQVGELYGAEDEARRARGFTIFSVGINVGAIAGPLICGLLASLYGWHAAFAAAGLLMLVGLLTYLAGYRHLAEPPARLAAAGLRSERLPNGEWSVLGFLLLLIAITIFISIACYQTLNIGMVWINRHVDLEVSSFRIPASWFAALGPIASIVAVPPLFALWKRQAARGREPGDMDKIMTGAWLAAAANGVLAAASLLTNRAPLIVPILYAVGLGAAYLYYWPTLMALVSSAAPPRLRGTLMGCLFLSLFAANLLIGWLGRFYDDRAPAAFWALEAVFGAVGALLVFALKRPMRRKLATPA
jgi:POT family proton-dependent oligopeptide transporter